QHHTSGPSPFAGRGFFWFFSQSVFFALPRLDLTGPAVAGRPLRSMSPGLRLRLRPPPLLTRKGLPATAGLGSARWRRRAGLDPPPVGGSRPALQDTPRIPRRRAGVPFGRK